MVSRCLNMKRIFCLTTGLLLTGIYGVFPQTPAALAPYGELPETYFRLLDAGVLRIENRLRLSYRNSDSPLPGIFERH